MAQKKPDKDSTRTMERATALTWARGCWEWNPCWSDCYEAALDAITEGELDDWDREQATTSNYWRYTHESR